MDAIERDGFKITAKEGKFVLPLDKASPSLQSRFRAEIIAIIEKQEEEAATARAKAEAEARATQKRTEEEQKAKEAKAEAKRVQELSIQNRLAEIERRKAFESAEREEKSRVSKVIEAARKKEAEELQVEFAELRQKHPNIADLHLVVRTIVKDGIIAERLNEEFIPPVTSSFGSVGGGGGAVAGGISYAPSGVRIFLKGITEAYIAKSLQIWAYPDGEYVYTDPLEKKHLLPSWMLLKEIPAK
ncbi:MAG: hypothetical protein WCO60_12860 [Verrucomicrobiota bacterium]